MITLAGADAAYDPTALHRSLMLEMTPAYAYAGEEVSVWQARLRERLTALLGLDRMPQKRPPLAVRTIWRREVPLGTIEKLRFVSEPGHEVPAYLCLPRDVQKPYPVFLCLQGHSTGMHNSIAVRFDDEQAPLAVEGDRDFGLGCLQQGIAALCIEQRGFGECRDRSGEGCHNPALLALMLGRTLLGERIYDVDRAVDLLLQRDDMDAGRLGVLGNSGGGTAAMFAGGLLERITHVMPSCSFSSFRASIMAMHHCLCNYIPGLLTVAEMADVVGLCAPKPLVLVNGRSDEIFPLEAAEESFAQVREIYRASGRPERCRHVIAEGGHRFYAASAWAAMLPLLRA